MNIHSHFTDAAIIVGHGSILSDAGGAMVRIADTLRVQAVLPIVEAGFLNYNRPTFADALASAVEQGATKILVLPYFLIVGVYVSNDLQQLLGAARLQYPTLHFSVGDVIGTHPAMVELVLQRLSQLDDNQNRANAALLFVAHGTPLEAANVSIANVLREVQSTLGYDESLIGYLDCNQPDIPTAFDQLAERGVSQIDVLPYFLHLGRHVRKDLPAHFAAARQRHSKIDIRIARHLDDETILSRICAERIRGNVT